MFDNEGMDSIIRRLDDRLTDLDAFYDRLARGPVDVGSLRVEVAQVVSDLSSCVGDLVAALRELDERVTDIESTP
jgi:hypothetical protein